MRFFCFGFLLSGAMVWAAPAITSLAPNPVNAGGPYFELQVNGSGFTGTSKVVWGGTTVGATFVRPSLIRVPVTPEMRALSGTFPLTVVNPDGAASDATPFYVSPVLIAVAPSAVAPGGAAVTIVATGVGFTPNDVVVVRSGSSTVRLATTYVDPTQLKAVAPASLLATAFSGTAQVINPAGGDTSGQVTFDVRGAPKITAASPPVFNAGGPSFTLRVTGANFSPGMTARWDAAAADATYVSATELGVAITPELRALSGKYNLTVTDAGGFISNAFPLTVSPVISSVSPGGAAASGIPATIKVTGVGLTRNNWVLFSAGGQQRTLPTVLSDAVTLTATIPGEALTAARPATLQIVDAGGGVSETLSFRVDAPGPAVWSLNPASITAGAGAFTLTVAGSGFARGAVVRWAGLDLATAFGSASEVTAAVPSALVAMPGVAGVTVVNPGSLASAVALFRVLAAPVITAVVPAAWVEGTPVLIRVTGANLIPGASITWNGSALATTFGSATELTAIVPAEQMKAGTSMVGVLNPGGSEAARRLPFQVDPAPAPIESVPSLTALEPAAVSAGSAGFRLTAAGSGFGESAKVEWNGIPLETVFADGTRLAAVVPAALVGSAGNASITVSNAAGRSNALAFRIGEAGPVVAEGGIVNAASGLPAIAPGSLIAILGAHLASGEDRSGTTPLATTLLGTSVEIDGRAAPLLSVSEGRIEAQAPYETGLGRARVVVRTAAGESAPAWIEVTAVAPGVVMADAKHALAQNAADGSVISAANPARAGQYIVLYLTGQGRVDPPVATGTAAPAPAAKVLAVVEARIGGVAAEVAFAGLTPGCVGVLQVNLRVPPTASGEQEIEIWLDGTPANPTTLWIAGQN